LFFGIHNKKNFFWGSVIVGHSRLQQTKIILWMTLYGHVPFHLQTSKNSFLFKDSLRD
jgi:hypothetical protein